MSMILIMSLSCCKPLTQWMHVQLFVMLMRHVLHMTIIFLLESVTPTSKMHLKNTREMEIPNGNATIRYRFQQLVMHPV